LRERLKHLRLLPESLSIPSITMDTHNLIVDFGKHKGIPWTRVPVDYLFWLVNQDGENPRKELAKAELERRGTKPPSMDISGHAVDRASMQLWKDYFRERQAGEGLYRWLQRKAEHALEHGERRGGKIIDGNIKFVFDEGVKYPTLLTVMRIK
jgi:hypothetical protein